MCDFPDSRADRRWMGYAGRVGLAVRGNQYGPKRALLAQLLIEYADGTKEIIGTDTSWQVTTDGPRRKACFFDGEIYDARQADPNAATYTPARLYEGELPEQVVPDVGVPVKVHEKVKLKRIWKNAAGETLVDFGRNMAGILEIGPIDGKAGQRIVIRHGELVQNDELYTGNLRTAKQTLDYTCRDGIQTYRPEFTYMGFQYVAVTGMEVTEENLAAWDIYSDMEQIGDFSCSDERLNQFQKIFRPVSRPILWTSPQTVPRGMSAAAGPGTLPCLPRRQPSIWILPVS